MFLNYACWVSNLSLNFKSEAATMDLEEMDCNNFTNLALKVAGPDISTLLATTVASKYIQRSEEIFFIAWAGRILY